MRRAWTLGYPPAYDIAVAMPGNGKAPGGYAFRTKRDAEHYRRTHNEAKRFRPYVMYIPGTFEECTTTDPDVAARARHTWHKTDNSSLRESTAYMALCAICAPEHRQPLDHAVLTVLAPFIDPSV